MADNIKTLDGNNFDATVKGDTPVLVDFWAPWCGPCKAIAPILEDLAGELGDQVTIGKVNVDEPANQQLGSQFGIQAIPTLLLFKSGEVVEKIVGLTSKDALKEKVLAHA